MINAVMCSYHFYRVPLVYGHGLYLLTNICVRNSNVTRRFMSELCTDEIVNWTGGAYMNFNATPLQLLHEIDQWGQNMFWYDIVWYLAWWVVSEPNKRCHFRMFNAISQFYFDVGKGVSSFLFIDFHKHSDKNGALGMYGCSSCISLSGSTTSK